MNSAEDMDRLQQRCDMAEAALREAQRELADYATDMEAATKTIRKLNEELLRWKEMKP